MLYFLLLQGSVAVPPVDPWPLFKSVCMSGGSTLPTSAVRESAASELPDGARHALGKNLIDNSVIASLVPNMVISASTTIPNKIYALRATRGYLVLPTPGDRKANAFGGMCALVIQGDQFLEALQQLSPREAVKVRKRLLKQHGTPSAFSDFRARSGHYEVSLTAVDGWTSAAVNADR